MFPAIFGSKRGSLRAVGKVLVVFVCLCFVAVFHDFESRRFPLLYVARP